MKTILSMAVILMLMASIGIAQDLVKVFPNNTKVVLENDKVRMIEIWLKAGDKVPTHSHPNHILYALGAGSMKLKTMVGDKATESELKAGEGRWIAAVTHSNEALTDGKALVIELKEPMKMEEKKMEKK